jgi:hypothetical protein
VLAQQPRGRRVRRRAGGWRRGNRIALVHVRIEPRIRLGRCLIAHTLKSTHIATALQLIMKATTVSQLVDELSRFTDAEQWLIVAAVALLVVAFTGYVGLAVCLVARTVVSIGRRAAAWRRSGRTRAKVRALRDSYVAGQL